MKNKIALSLFLLLCVLLPACRNDVITESGRYTSELFESNTVNVSGFGYIRNSLSNSVHYIYFFEDSHVKAYDKENKSSFDMCHITGCNHENCIFGEKCQNVLYGGNNLFVIYESEKLTEIYISSEDGESPAKIYETEYPLSDPSCRNDTLYFIVRTENGKEILSLDCNGSVNMEVAADDFPISFCPTDTGVCYISRSGGIFFNDIMISENDADEVRYKKGHIYFSSENGIYDYDIKSEKAELITDKILSDWVMTIDGILYTAETENGIGISLFDISREESKVVCDIGTEIDFWLTDGISIYTMAETAEDAQRSLDECRMLFVNADGSVVPMYNKKKSLVRLVDIK